VQPRRIRPIQKKGGVWGIFIEQQLAMRNKIRQGEEMLETIAALTTPDALESQITVTQQVFALMAGIEVYPSAAALAETAPFFESVLDYLSICKGSIVLECSAPVAFAFTARLMGIPTPRTFDDDVKDSMGELVNMIGGNLKGLLSVDTVLSAPVVFYDKHAPLRHIHAKLTSIDFDCEFGLFRLSLYGDA
jgi:CheY-specific phosphatase CheX